ncbi:DsbA family oxidoreductase [Vibrio metoecus]|uniref:DsbA family oxidoreductase n=1 Tax=Vibrio metoecus TaxID=1481663 RepID=UPI00215CD93D|nr:DsbA family oxidoreductase [Vibrio metoecus]MCR9387845.1 DsbA family oxidoreductase [Vibrio metoecus]
MHKLTIDLVSDVVCPWCVIGYFRLNQALSRLPHIEATLRWHPYELNPRLAAGGENLREHLAKKYGTSVEASQQARNTLTELGKEVGFEFHFFDQMRIYNTRKAHQLLLWANQQDKQLPLKLALWRAYFQQGKAIDEDEVLLEIAETVGLERTACQQILNDESWAKAVANTEQQWLQASIHAVPTLIIEQKYLISGAQTSDILFDVLQRLTAKTEHGHKHI